MSRYTSRRQVGAFPRLPLKGALDLTSRCNNDCRHCWLRLPPDAPEAGRELPFDEIRRLVDEARAAGCREWTISGGEPMLRPDFAEIFDYVTSRSAAYTLVTNGTLITPAAARLMKRRGAKLVSVYGATAEVHDRITRAPGSFEALEQGISRLREAGTGFTVQVVPMKGNFHQYREMIALAESWSPSWRLGAAWLHLSGDAAKDGEIAAERLSPEQVVELDPPAPSGPDAPGNGRSTCAAGCGDGLYADCIASRREFHIDPYGGMSFCGLVRDPALRVDVREVGFARAWEHELPAMAAKVLPEPAYEKACGTCRLRTLCRWCPAYGYLEHGDHSTKVEYLCRVAAAADQAAAGWVRSHRRYYGIGGLTVRVDSDLPFADGTFRPKFELFRTDGPAGETISIHHHFSLPDLVGEDLGTEAYLAPPWQVFRKGGTWVYVGIPPRAGEGSVHRVIVADDPHTRIRVFNPSPELFLRGGLDSLMLLPSDQIFLARALPRLGGAFLHAAGVDLGGRGLLFAGPSEAGKSTMVKMLRSRGRGRILCDDRTIVRRGAGGFEVHGTWSHGEVPEVSPGKAPLRAVFFLRQAKENRLERIGDPGRILKDLLPRFVRPLLTADWWENVLDLAGDLARTVPFYDLHFDKSGAVVDRLEELVP